MMQGKKVTYKTFVLTAVIGSLIIVAMLTVNTIRMSRRTAVATDEAASAVSLFYLEAMADRRAKTITNLISNSFDQMGKAVSYIENNKIGSQEELRYRIGTVESLLGLDQFALVDEENVVYTHYTTYTGGSRHSFLSDEQLNDRIISTVSLYGSSKKLCLAAPTRGLVIMGKRFKACFVQFDIRDIVDLLAFDDQGRTHFALYTKGGGNLSGTELGPVILNHNFFEALKGIVPDAVLEENHRNFEEEKGGDLSFSFNNAQETLYYVPIDGTGWEMAVLIRESVIHDQFLDISENNLEASRNMIILTLLSVLFFAAVLLFQLISISKARLEEEKETSRSFHNMANTDAMTGVRNKYAYSEREASVNQKIKTGEIQKVAVVVCDINGLKAVNDSQGHAKGDQLIKDACKMICRQFSHGTVFRIGGDEFVVLLKDEGYDTMLEDIEEFNRKVEANISENGVVVSIGYSVLEQEDRQLRDVFERADKMMYERKKELKEMGAATR